MMFSDNHLPVEEPETRVVSPTIDFQTDTRGEIPDIRSATEASDDSASLDSIVVPGEASPASGSTDECGMPTDDFMSEERSCIGDEFIHNDDLINSDQIYAEAKPLELAGATFNRQVYFFAVFIFAVIADQITKALAVYRLGYIGENVSFIEFLGDYYSRFREFPWRIGETGYKPAVDVIDGYLRWQLTTNTGAAYSMFSNNPGKLAIVSAVLSVFLYYLYLRFGKGSVVWPIAFGLQIGGAIGNFIDRARLGEVVDFIATKSPGLIRGRFAMIDFPIYNVADACAVVGTIIIGLMFIAKDVQSSVAGRKARFELDYFGCNKHIPFGSASPIKHDRYSADVEFLAATPLSLVEFGESDIEHTDDDTPSSSNG